MPNEFTALHSIPAPGTSVLGYSRGMPVTGAVVEAWGLVVGGASDPEADVVAGDLPADAPEEVAVPRPDDGANRAAWESYAIASGMKAEDAAAAPIEELQALGTEQAARPADSAPKAAWIEYAIASGAAEAWATDSATTKADLQAYGQG